ncbi:MAG: hypothetical protein ACLFXM_15965 [Acidimicrobiia bacterium]
MSDRSGDRGTGVFASAAGLLVFLLFLLLAAHVLIGLFATSVVRAALNDAATRAAAGGPPGGEADLARLADEAEASLGRMGERTTVELAYVDDDGDDLPDVVEGRAVAVPPGLIPRTLGGAFGVGEVDVSVRIRVERFR